MCSSDLVHMALDDVSVEAAVGWHGEFQIDECASFQAREGRTGPGFRCEVGMEGVCSYVESGKADTADGNAGAGFELLGELTGFNLDAAVFTLTCDAGYVADFFDDSGEHEF